MNKKINFKSASRLGLAAAALAVGSMLGGAIAPAHAQPCAPGPSIVYAEDGIGYEVTGQGSLHIYMPNTSCLPVKVHWQTLQTNPVSAKANVDYVSASGDAIVPPGMQGVYVPLTLIPDNLNEVPNEQFAFKLSAPVFATIGGSGMATVTIREGAVQPG